MELLQTVMYGKNENKKEHRAEICNRVPTTEAKQYSL